MAAGGSVLMSQGVVGKRVMALVLCAVGLLGLVQPAGGPPPATVRLADVRLESIEQRRQVTGEVRAHRQSTLAAQEGGLVVEMLADIGDVVEAGAIIARLDPTRLAIERDEAAARVMAAEATVTERASVARQAERDLERVREVLERESGAQPELERAESTFAAEEARLKAAQASKALEEARAMLIEQRLADLEIRAPFAGRIVAKRTEIGQWVREGDGVMDVIETTPIDVWVDVPESLVAAASAATTIDVHIPALGMDVQARVVAVVFAADPRSRLFPVRLELSNVEGAIKPGMSATGLVPIGQQAATLLVPKDAVLKGEAGFHVYFDAGGRAAMAPVERLFAVGDQVAIRSQALSEGMKVVVDGNERLFPGQPLNVISGSGQ